MSSEHLNRVKELAARFNDWEATAVQRTQPTLIASKVEKDADSDDSDDKEIATCKSPDDTSGSESPDSSDHESSDEESDDESEAAAQDEEQAPQPAAAAAAKQVDQSNVLVSNRADEIDKFKLPDDDIEEAAKKIKVPVEKVKIYNDGVQAYAFVKQNSGMLKPVKLFYQPLTGRLYIVRKKDDEVHSLYIHIDYFEELDCQPGSMAYLARSSNDEVLVSTVNELESMPHMVLWTNDKFNAKESGKVKSWFRRKKQQPQSRRSLVFIFETGEKRDLLLDLLNASAPIHAVKYIHTKKAPDYAFTCA